MIVNRNFAKVVSALFFLEFSFLLAFGIIHFFPDYSFMKTHLFRIIAFIVIAVLSSFFMDIYLKIMKPLMERTKETS